MKFQKMTFNKWNRLIHCSANIHCMGLCPDPSEDRTNRTIQMITIHLEYTQARNCLTVGVSYFLLLWWRDARTQICPLIFFLHVFQKGKRISSFFHAAFIHSRGLVIGHFSIFYFIEIYCICLYFCTKLFFFCILIRLCIIEKKYTFEKSTQHARSP